MRYVLMALAAFSTVALSAQENDEPQTNNSEVVAADAPASDESAE